MVPRIWTNDQGQDRLLILPNEDSDASTRTGRPIGPEYYDYKVKLEFMAKHGITQTVLSLGNPWLDFLPGQESTPLAKDLNEDLQAYCLEHEMYFYGFGVLPTNSPKDCVDELYRISKLDRLRGAIVGDTLFSLYRLELMVVEMDWTILHGSLSLQLLKN